MKYANETQRARTKMNKTQTPTPKASEQWFQQHQETPQKILLKVNITFSSLKFIVLSISSSHFRLLKPSSDVITTRKPGSDFDWLIV